MMTRIANLALLMTSAVSLGGCVASMAASALSMAVKGTQGHPQSNAQYQPVASKMCAEQASHYGTAHVIDVEQRALNKTVVWGTVSTGAVQQSFECSFGTKITGFKLRPITPR